MEQGYDETFDKSSIKTADRLNYKAVIQDLISNYLKSIGTFNLGRSVIALRNSILFEIPGLPFKTEIMKKERELKDIRVASIVALVENDPDEWYHPIRKMINLWTVDEKFFMAYGEFLVDLIARYDGLIGVKSLVELGDPESKIVE